MTRLDDGSGGAPFDWQRWEPEVLARAARCGRTLLLLIGDPANPGARDMARQLHADSALAGFVQEHYLPVRVDRHEQPDLDHFCQVAHQLLTREPGGWPLLLCVDPDSRLPWFSGGYFPAQAAGGLPALGTVLHKAAQFAREQARLRQSQDAMLREALHHVEGAGPAAVLRLDRLPLDGARRQLEATTDALHGGWAGSPRFAQPQRIDFLLRHWHDSAATPEPDLPALYLASLALTRMAGSGLQQDNGGFAHCALGPGWSAPQGGLLLADNAALLALYTRAWQATGEARFADVAGGVADFLLQTLRRDDGGFRVGLGELPQCQDGRCATAGNALAVEALASAARALDRDDCAVAADAAFARLRREHWLTDRLLAFSVADGGGRVIDASLDDHAALIHASLALCALRPGRDDLAWAGQLADQMLARFEDTARGGFFTGVAGPAAPALRLRRMADEPQPGGNALAASALLQLGSLRQQPRWLQAAERTVLAAWPALLAQPAQHTGLLAVLRGLLDPPTLVPLVEGDAAAVTLARQLRRPYAPRLLVAWLGAGDV
ncbi:MAG: hypothetical protein RL026_660 [Pseudomonadota bacterium]